MADAYKTGLSLLRAGRWFEAHEELELAWRAAAPEERDFYQGLVHVAVAWYQAGRGRTVATESQLRKAMRRLEPYGVRHGGLDLESLQRQLLEAYATVLGGSLDLPPPDL